MPPSHRRDVSHAWLLYPGCALLAIAVVVAGLVTGLLGRSTGDDTGTTLSGDETDARPADLEPSDGPAPQASSRPNVVMVLADDMRTDDLRWMPHVRQLLVDQGLEFRNSFATYPLCAPARASLLTGEYAHNHGVLSHTPPYGFEAFDDRHTIATSLNAAGYNTLFLGKYVNGYGAEPSKVTGQSSFRYVPPGWTDWWGSVQRPTDSGYDAGGTYDYDHVIFNHDGRIDDSYAGQYQTDVEGRIASEMVTTYHRSPKPFFLYFAPIAPHFGTPRESDDPTHVRWPVTHRREQIKTPARPPWVRGRFDHVITRASGLPAGGGPSQANVSRLPRPMNKLPEIDDQERGAMLNLTRQRAEALYVLDQQVGRLVATLKRTGEYDDTVIMFTSDNGYFLGEHRKRQGKTKAYEPSLRVPFVMAGKGVPHGQRYDPVTTEGVSATILDLAGASPPHPPDGVSVVPSIAHDRGWRTPVLTEAREDLPVFIQAEALHPAPGFGDGLTESGLRTARWKYVRYVDGDGELYDLDNDPNERNNLYDEPAYASIQARLAALWKQRRSCVGAACRAPMPADLQRGPTENASHTNAQSLLVRARYGYDR